MGHSLWLSVRKSVPSTYTTSINIYKLAILILDDIVVGDHSCCKFALLVIIVHFNIREDLHG